MHGVGGQILTRARLPGNQDGMVGLGHHPDGFIHPLHNRAFAHQLL